MSGQIVQCPRCRILLHQPPGAPYFYCVCGVTLQATNPPPHSPRFVHPLPPTDPSNWPRPMAPMPAIPVIVPPPTSDPPTAPAEARSTMPGSSPHSLTTVSLAPRPSQHTPPVTPTHVGLPSIPEHSAPGQKNPGPSAVLAQSRPYAPVTSHQPGVPVTMRNMPPGSAASSLPIPTAPATSSLPGHNSGGGGTKVDAAVDMVKRFAFSAAKGVGQSTGLMMPTDVTVNGARLNPQEIQQLRLSGVYVRDGRYWYDTLCGAYGDEGGPFKGFIPPGLPMGAPLRSDASNGTSGVFINGRQLATSDVVRLQMAGVPVQQGRWWMNGTLQYGAEGSSVPLGQLPKQGAGHGGHNGGGNGLWRSNISDTYGGSDSNGNFYVAGDGWSVANF